MTFRIDSARRDWQAMPSPYGSNYENLFVRFSERAPAAPVDFGRRGPKFWNPILALDSARFTKKEPPMISTTAQYALRKMDEAYAAYEKALQNHTARIAHDAVPGMKLLRPRRARDQAELPELKAEHMFDLCSRLPVDERRRLVEMLTTETGGASDMAFDQSRAEVTRALDAARRVATDATPRPADRTRGDRSPSQARSDDFARRFPGASKVRIQ